MNNEVKDIKELIKAHLTNDDSIGLVFTRDNCKAILEIFEKLENIEQIIADESDDISNIIRFILEQ